MIVMLVTKVMVLHVLMSMNVQKIHVLQPQVQCVETQMVLLPVPVPKDTPVMVSIVSTLTSVVTIYAMLMLHVQIPPVLTYVSAILDILVMERNVKM